MFLQIVGLCVCILSVVAVVDASIFRGLVAAVAGAAVAVLTVGVVADVAVAVAIFVDVIAMLLF